MNDPSAVRELGVVVFYAFFGLYFGALARMVIRAVNNVRRKRRLSLIAIRDLVVFGLFGLDFMLLLWARATGENARLTTNIGWAALTSGIVLFAIGTLFAFEWFVIGRVDELNGDSHK